MTPLIIAARKGEPAIADLLIQHNALTGIDNLNATYVSSAYNNIPILKSVRQAGADINLPNTRGWTPLRIDFFGAH